MQTALDDLGGEDALRVLVNVFYDLVEKDERGENLRRLHSRGHGIPHAREEQFNFLSGFFGGRRYYEEKHRHMNVKLMHAHVPIFDQDSQEWLALMDQALDQCGHVGAVKERLMANFTRVAQVLVNDGVVPEG
jgi:hemoglobin